ncbi:MAG: hydrogenase expression protein [Kiritimatiellaeota bacterium]|nr:hydrogenase expression protein [Kiritimatiellota bacterium]
MTYPSDNAPLPAGKISPSLLQHLLAGLSRSRQVPGLVIGPALGEDAAVLELDSGLWAVAADPITFSTPRPGWYAVHVNANDAAVMGAAPKYFLLTVLLPPGTRASQVEDIMTQAAVAADSLGASVIGGHTEVTEAVTAPVIAGTVLGRLLCPAPVRTGGGRPGDALLQVQPMAIEGASILATEHRRTLEGAVDPETVACAAAFLDDPGISVVAPARLLVEGFPVHAMHDPTEGGLATGIRELATASGTGVRVRRQALLIAPETRRICATLGYDPLGLISSGCLLAALPADSADAAVCELRNAGFAAARIGELTDRAGGMVLEEPSGHWTELPEFLVDQLAASPPGAG